MSNRDLERGAAKNPPNTNPNRNYSTAPYYIETSEKQWTPWLVPMFVVANIAMFIVVMYVNNCPDSNLGFGDKCVAGFLGRFSFQPIKENPLLGPSSNTYVSSFALFFLYFFSVLCFVLLLECVSRVSLILYAPEL